jgi:hypothetical protein
LVEKKQFLKDIKNCGCSSTVEHPPVTREVVGSAPISRALFGIISSMKKIGNFLAVMVLLGIIGASGYFVYEKSLSPCQKTLEYSIGRFDTQFGISKTEFKLYLAEAEVVWEKQIGRNVFEYNQSASFKINLIYDERQLETVQKQKDEFGLTAIEDIFKKLDLKFNLFKNQYDQSVAAYEQNLALYKAGKYSNAEIRQLNAQAHDLNDMTAQLNALLEERNAKAAEYNRVADNYNKKYNKGLEFNQAEYTGKEINVYQFGNKKDLIMALSHEFGHALNMGHVENNESVMYYLTSSNTAFSPVLSSEDLVELNRVCKIK